MDTPQVELTLSPGLRQAIDEEIKKPRYQNMNEDIAVLEATKAVAATQPDKFTSEPGDQLALLLTKD